MFIDYSRYTVDELLDVHENIDRESYPDRFQALCEEIQRRKDNGEYEKRLEEIAEYEEDDDNEADFIIEFSSEGSGTIRKVFIAIFMLLNVIILAVVIPKYKVPELQQIHEYATEVGTVECKIEQVVDDETDKIYTYYDLNVESYQSVFTAVDIDGKTCQSIEKYLQAGDSISIWHERGIIYQLKAQNRVLLSYKYMKPRVRELNTYDAHMYWIGLLFLWGVLFKSLVNAIVPGTFISQNKII